MNLRRRTRTAAPARPVVADDRVERRVEAAVRMASADAAVVARIGAAPSGYVLSQSSSDLARHAALLEPLPRVDEVRVLVTPGRAPGTWNLDIATRDRPGLLARFTGALLHTGVDVVQAVVATWDDGAALQALVVRGAAPDAGELEVALCWALDQPLSAPPVADAVVRFDPPAGDYTGCEVVAADRPGLLHAIAVAIATSGADIHAAAVATTDDGTAHDRFDLTDQHGRPLPPALEAVIAAHLATGVRDTLQSRRVRA